jgi:hypothetical protein
LWPRHEVLQLVLPVFSSCGTALTNNVIVAVAKRLMQVENSAGVVTFDQFILISSDILKWHETTSQLFWDMLHAAVWYKVQVSLNNMELKTNHIILFLSLHIPEPSGVRSPGAGGSPHQFDSVWPGAAESGAGLEGARSPMSPHSPTSSPPSKEKKHFFASISPKSPRNTGSLGHSPRSSSPSSPRKALATGFRPTAAHHLNSIRQRLPLVLRALSLRADPTAVAGGNAANSSPSNPHGGLEEDLFLYQSDIDCLGLIIGGGSNRDEEVPLLSALHPHAPTDGSTESNSGHPVHFLCNETLEWFVANLCVNESVYPSSATVPASLSSSPNAADVKGISDAPATNILIASKTISHTGPVRIIYPVQYLSTSRPTVISGACSVIVHAMAVNSSRRDSRSRSGTASSFQESLTAAVRSASGMTLDEASNKDMFSPNATSSWCDGGMDTSCSMDRDDSSSGLQSVQSNVLSLAEYEKVGDFIDALKMKTTTESLPHLNMQSCAHTSIYVLSPYATGSIANCSDCEVVTGPVAGTLIVADCERVRLTTVARKIILRNCYDCVINCQTVSPVIVAGDSRGLLVGPYNTSYKDLAVHLELAALTALMKPELRRIAVGRLSRSSSNVYPVAAAAPPSRAYLNRSVSECLDDGDETDEDSERETQRDHKDMWTVLWDAAMCADQQHPHHAGGDAPLNPFVYGGSGLTMPAPSESTAMLQPADKFRFLAIPEQSQYQTFDHCPMDIPVVYTRHLELHKMAGAALAVRVSNELNIPPPPPPPSKDGNGSSPPRAGTAADAKTGAEGEVIPPAVETEGTNLLSGKFMEWLLTTGKASQVIELIRLDQQLVVQQQQQNSSMSTQSSTASISATDSK